MAIETLDDIVEALANRLDIYGAHPERRWERQACKCRACFSAELTRRIRAAIEVERKLGADHG